MKSILLAISLLSFGMSFCMDAPKDALSFFSQAPTEIFQLVVPTIDDEYNDNIAEMTPLLVYQKYAPAIKFAQTCSAANVAVSRHYPCLQRCRTYSTAFFTKNGWKLSNIQLLPAYLFNSNEEEFQKARPKENFDLHRLRIEEEDTTPITVTMQQ